MSCYHIYVESGRKKARLITSVEDYRALRSSQEQEANLKQARAGDGEAKKRLVQFNYSGYYPNGVVKGNKLPSATFGFDIDDKETFDIVSTVLLASPSDYGLLMLERSVSQGGHAVFKREMGKTILENQVRIATQLECEIDTNAHDINRVYFATSDSPEDLLYVSEELFSDAYDETTVKAEANLLAERERNGQEDLPPGAHKANKHYKPWESAGIRELENQGISEVSAGAEATSLNPQTPKSLEPENYQGIPYSAIISKWWELHNDGQEPVKSNRNVLTYELAVNLRHICGFDRVLMAKVIPSYDDFPLQEKMRCIDSALAQPLTQMPLRLKNVLQALRKDYRGDASIQNALDEVQLDDELFYFKRFPKGSLPQGIIDSVKAAGDSKIMPVITAVAPMIGMLATNVQLEIHGNANHLNLISYICGKAGSGKGSLDPIVEEWLSEVRAQDDLYLQQEAEYKTRKLAAKNSKNQPEEPKLPVRILALNNTLPNIAQRLANTDGIHSFSFTPEADTVTARWKSALSDYSVMLRQAYDGSRYDREAKSAEAVSCHVKKLLWNTTFCGTQDALYRLISNYTDGLLSRLSIARLPDNTFTPLVDKPAKMMPEYADRIRQIAHLLPLMQGTLVLPKLEQRSRDWVEKIRLEAMMNNDTVLADARLRDHVNAYRITTCLILCMVAERLIKAHGYFGAEQKLKSSVTLTQEMAERCQTPAMLEVYDIVADSLIDNDMYFFKERIENAYKSNNNTNNSRNRRGRNDTIYERLPEQFTYDDAFRLSTSSKGSDCTKNAVQQMLKNWSKQGLIVVSDNRYIKCRA